MSNGIWNQGSVPPNCRTATTGPPPPASPLRAPPCMLLSGLNDLQLLPMRRCRELGSPAVCNRALLRVNTTHVRRCTYSNASGQCRASLTTVVCNQSSMQSLPYRTGGTWGCNRTCPTPLPNVVAYKFQGKAGLGDRQYMLTRLAELAWDLCARLESSPPCKMLGAKHNNDIPISCDRKWADYFNRSLADGTKFPQRFQVSRVQEAIVIRTTDVRLDFPRVRRQLQTGKRFVWEINTNFYKWDASFRASYMIKPPVHPPPCHPYTRTGVVALQDAAVATLWASRNLSQITRHNYTVVHIRRGDKLHLQSKHPCDTSINAISRLLRCQNTLGMLGSGVLVMTDERDRAYLDRLRASLRASVPPIQSLVFIEPLLLQIATTQGWETDNYLVYGVALSIRAGARHVISFRGQGAKGCVADRWWAKHSDQCTR